MRTSQQKIVTLTVYFLGVAGVALFLSQVLAPRHKHRPQPAPVVIEQPEKQDAPESILAPAIPAVNENRNKTKTRRVKGKPKRMSRNLYDAGGFIPTGEMR